MPILNHNYRCPQQVYHGPAFLFEQYGILKIGAVVVILTALGMVLAASHLQTGRDRLRWWALPGNDRNDALVIVPEGTSCHPAKVKC